MHHSTKLTNLTEASRNPGSAFLFRPQSAQDGLMTYPTHKSRRPIVCTRKETSTVLKDAARSAPPSSAPQTHHPLKPQKAYRLATWDFQIFKCFFSFPKLTHSVLKLRVKK